MRTKLKTLTVLLPMAAFALLLGSCAATTCNGGACQAREISSVNDKDEEGSVWDHRPQRPKLRGEY
jgi:hypothetical protein